MNPEVDGIGKEPLRESRTKINKNGTEKTKIKFKIPKTELKIHHQSEP